MRSDPIEILREVAAECAAGANRCDYERTASIRAVAAIWNAIEAVDALLVAERNTNEYAEKFRMLGRHATAEEIRAYKGPRG
jgi:hypothetical protein